MSTINMRELTRRTKSVVEEVIRTGRPAIVTIHGRPQVAVTPLVGAVEAAEEHVLNNAAPGLQAAIRAGEADLVSGRTSRVEETEFVNAYVDEAQPPTEAQALAEVQEQLDAKLVKQAIRRAARSPHAVEKVRAALMEGEVLTVGSPGADRSAPGKLARGGIVTYSDEDDPSGHAALMPVFTTVEILRSALRSHRAWQTFDVLVVSGRSLVENVDPDVTLVIDPGSDEEFRIPPMKLRTVSVEQAVYAPAQLFAR